MAEPQIELRTMRRTFEQIAADSLIERQCAAENTDADEDELEAVEFDLRALADRWIELRRAKNRSARLDAFCRMLSPIYGG